MHGGTQASEVAPLDALLLAELMGDVGVPPGVYNVVTGLGEVVGQAIASHPDVDMVTFTGSSRGGIAVLTAAAPTIKKVAVELGGKSAALIADDVDADRFEKAVRATVASCFLNSGQTCSALTRLLVPRSRLAEAEQIAAAATARLTVGDPFDEASRLGPLASGIQRDRVVGYVRLGIAEGARLVAGDEAPPSGLTAGYYVSPAVFSDVTAQMRIANEEIFGPVLCIMPYDTVEEGVAIANGTPFGLAGAVWADTDERALQLAGMVSAGQIDINGGRFNPEAPFGGFKQSGLGREFGPFGFGEFFEIKSLQLPV